MPEKNNLSDKMPLVFGLREHSEAKHMIGEMVMAYSEIEFNIFGIFRCAIDPNDTAMPFRMFFRLRTESQRLDVFDAVCRPYMKRLELSPIYEKTLGAIRHCKKIRNQYAHCTWSAVRPLEFLKFEDAAKKTEPNSIPLHYVSPELVREQYLYFSITMLWCRFLSEKAGVVSKDKVRPEPKQFPAKPHLYIVD